MQVELVSGPMESDFAWAKECAIGTDDKYAKKHVKNAPDDEWLHRILRARHSPIRELRYRYVMYDVPYWVSVHLVRHHEGVNWYVQSQRNDRQDRYDRNAARQDTPVTVRASINAEALMNLANKRLCNKASPETQALVREMCRLAEERTPSLKGFLVPMCERIHGCEEMYSCGRWEAENGCQ